MGKILWSNGEDIAVLVLISPGEHTFIWKWDRANKDKIQAVIGELSVAMPEDVARTVHDRVEQINQLTFDD